MSISKFRVIDILWRIQVSVLESTWFTIESSLFFFQRYLIQLTKVWAVQQAFSELFEVPHLMHEPFDVQRFSKFTIMFWLPHIFGLVISWSIIGSSLINTMGEFLTMIINSAIPIIPIKIMAMDVRVAFAKLIKIFFLTLAMPTYQVFGIIFSNIHLSMSMIQWYETDDFSSKAHYSTKQ